jgi:hypothetical protein
MGVILFVCGSTYSIAEETCKACKKNVIELSENFYLSTDQITFADQKIYVNIDNTFYVTPALFSDEKGFYIQLTRSKCRGTCPWYKWECSCGTCNLYELECAGCGGLKAYVKCGN